MRAGRAVRNRVGALVRRWRAGSGRRPSASLRSLVSFAVDKHEAFRSPASARAADAPPSGPHLEATRLVLAERGPRGSRSTPSPRERGSARGPCSAASATSGLFSTARRACSARLPGRLHVRSAATPPGARRRAVAAFSKACLELEDGSSSCSRARAGSLESPIGGYVVLSLHAEEPDPGDLAELDAPTLAQLLSTAQRKWCGSGPGGGLSLAAIKDRRAPWSPASPLFDRRSTPVGLAARVSSHSDEAGVREPERANSSAASVGISLRGRLPLETYRPRSPFQRAGAVRAHRSRTRGAGCA